MAQIFISYSRTDEQFARQLAKALSDLGADVWIDIEDIPVGSKWSRAIQQGLDTADVMLVIISPESMSSSNVEDEWQYYLDNGKPVVPILYRPAKIHFQLNRIQYVDFHNAEFEFAMRKLHTELAVQGIQLDPLAAGVTIPAMRPIRPPRAKNFQPMIYSMIGAFLLVVLVGVVIIISQMRDKNDNPADPVQSAEQLLQAMSDRNFGIANDLVCDAVNVQESATWGQELEDIFCHEIDGSDEVGCSFKINGDEFLITFTLDSENRICGQS